MTRSHKHIEIVRSTKSWLSSMSQASCIATQAVLAKHYAKVSITNVDMLDDLKALVARKPDLVFLGLRSIPENPALGFYDPNRIWLSAFLDEHNIQHTGSSYMAHTLERNKPLAKQRILEAGLATSPSYVVAYDKPFKIGNANLTYPLFVKPTNRGGGLGIDERSVVYTPTELESKVASISADLQSDSLVEEYLPGREFSVAILKDMQLDTFLLMPIELIAPNQGRGARVISGQTKSSNTEIVIAVTNAGLKTKVNALALDAFNALGARNYGRIDIRLNAAGVPQFLEANLIPSLIEGYGSFPKACVLNLGLDYESMLLKIVGLGLLRTPFVNLLSIDTLQPSLA